MAFFYEIFLNQKIDHKPLGPNVAFSYDLTRKGLTIFVDEKKVFHSQAETGDIYAVVVEGRNVHASKVKLPDRNRDFITAILGFGSSSRVHSMESYQVLLEKQRARHAFPGYQEWTTGADNDPFRLTICNHSNSEKIYHIAGFASGEMRKKDIIRMFNSFPCGFSYPKSYIEPLLSERLGFTCEDLMLINPKLYPSEFGF